MKRKCNFRELSRPAPLTPDFMKAERSIRRSPDLAVEEILFQSYLREKAKAERLLNEVNNLREKLKKCRMLSQTKGLRYKFKPEHLDRPAKKGKGL
jgi:hypothetical protein